jgi:outer membrane protein assembly factor BamB
MERPDTQPEQEYHLAAAEPEALACELERVIPLAPEDIAQPGIPSALRVKLARLSVIETIVMALIIALMCLGVVFAVMHFCFTPANVPQANTLPHGELHQYNTAAPPATTARSGTTAPPAAATTAPVPPLPEMLKWQYEFDANDVSVPVCGEDGSLFFTLDHTKLVGLATDGTERYTYEAPGGWRAKMTPPAAAENMSVIVGLSDGKVVKLDGWGDPAWEYDTDSSIVTRPVVDRYSLIYCTAADGGMFCLTPGGTLQWQCKLKGSYSNTAPVLALPGLLYQVSDSGAVALIAQGKVQWDKDFQLNPASQAVSGGGNLYAITSDGQLAAISRQGEELWRKSIGRRAVGAPCCGRDVVYVGSMDGELYAVSAAGEAQWMAQLGGQPIGMRRSGEDGRLYVWAQNGKFYAVDKNGQLLYSYDGEMSALGAVPDLGNTVYFVSFGMISALEE